MKVIFKTVKQYYKKVFLIVLPLLAAASVLMIALEGNMEPVIFGNSADRDIYKHTSDDDFVAVLDVGEAQAVLVCSNSRAALIDTGEDADAVLRELSRFKIKCLDYVFISHYHTDHTGGFEDICENIDVGCVVISQGEPDQIESNAIRKDVLSIADENNVPIRFTANRSDFKIGDINLNLIHLFENSVDENERSLVFRIDSPSSSMLVMSDAGFSVEQKLIFDMYNVDCDVLLAGHHGSNDATSAAFLSCVSPTTVIVSCSSASSYDHPGEEFLERVSGYGAELFTTFDCGTIKVNFSLDGVNIIS